MGLAKILIVEDESIVAADIEDTLHKIGYEVVGIVSSGEDALERAAVHAVDLILMDIQLKGTLDGIETAATVREKYNIPVVYLTAHADEATLERAKITEPYGYIVKPFEEIELKVALELALYKHRLDTPFKPPAPRSPDQLSAEQESVRSLLSTIEPFSQLALDDLTSFAEACHVKKLRSGSFVTLEDEGQPESFIVVSGRLAMMKTSSSGRELIVELLPPGDVLGLLSSITPESGSYTTRAKGDVEILTVPRSALIHLLDQHPALYRNLVDVIARRLSHSHDLARALAHDRVEVRIASTLCALLPRFHTASEPEKIKLTRQELADLTGSTVETAIRVTKSFERDGMLDLSHAGLIHVQNLSSLQDLAEE